MTGRTLKDSKFDIQNLYAALHSGSTSRRLAQLAVLNERIHEKGEHPEVSLDLNEIFGYLFQTYPLYIDRPSRRAVRACIYTLFINPNFTTTSAFLSSLTLESHIPGIAPSNAFVLLEWCSLVLPLTWVSQSLWEAHGLDLIAAHATLYDSCLGSHGRRELKVSASIITKRALKACLTVEKSSSSDDFLQQVVEKLTKEDNNVAGAKNANLLGTVAGVCARAADTKALLESKKEYIYSFYNREVLGSKKKISSYRADGLRDFFAVFTTEGDLMHYIAPILEKALLRAPEVMFDDIIRLLITSLSSKVTLDLFLTRKALKPLLSNAKSTDSQVRQGVLLAFAAIMEHCKETSSFEYAQSEILTPLKSAKVPSAEQRLLFAQMLAVIPNSISSANLLLDCLMPLSAKESNEAAANAEIAVLAKAVYYTLTSHQPLSSEAADVISKGVADKRVAFRKLWIVNFGHILLNLKRQPASQIISKFVEEFLSKITPSWIETLANPIPAAQSGLVVASYVMTVIFGKEAETFQSNSINQAVKKLNIIHEAFSCISKPSFLFSHKVYSKLTSKEDCLWALWSLETVASAVFHHGDDSTMDYWAQAFLYFISSPNVHFSVRREAVETLRAIYVEQPTPASRAIIKGLWKWRNHIEYAERDTAAISSKAGVSRLHFAVQSICISPQTVNQTYDQLGPDLLGDQLSHMLVLCRPEMIPKVSWINCCQKVGIDPGLLATQKASFFVHEIEKVFEDESLESVQIAACHSAADLCFVAPKTITPLVIAQISKNLDAEALHKIRPAEAAIYRTPEGTAFFNVVNNKANSSTLEKNSKDYETIKWEEDLRTKIMQKKGLQNTLTADEQAKVAIQLEKESKTRKEIAKLVSRIKCGLGLVKSLVTGPPSDVAMWVYPAITSVLSVIDADADFIVGEVALDAYLACSSLMASRLGVMRLFIGVATLRMSSNPNIAVKYTGELLSALVTRVLHRLRFVAEQKALDHVSFAYTVPLILRVLQQGGSGDKDPEENDEQILLTLEFLSLHTDLCHENLFPRAEIIGVLVSALQKYTVHYKLIKDCIFSICRAISDNVSRAEIGLLIKGTILPQISVRTSLLQAIDSELDIIDFDFSEELWIACHDRIQENAECARRVWEENGLEVNDHSAFQLISFLSNKDHSIRTATAAAIAEAAHQYPQGFEPLILELQKVFQEQSASKKQEYDEHGMPKKVSLTDRWEYRSGIALTFKELSKLFHKNALVPFIKFLIEEGPLGDKNDIVRKQMAEAATAIIAIHGNEKADELIGVFEDQLQSSNRTSEYSDQISEAVVILYGALALHLEADDERVPKVVQKLFAALNTPSEAVQYAIAERLPPLIRLSQKETAMYIQTMFNQLFDSKSFAVRRGAAYGLSGITLGIGIQAMHKFRIMSNLHAATEDKKNSNRRQGALFAYELLALVLGRVFEPYIIEIVPQLLKCFGDTSMDVREACLDAAKTCFVRLSPYGVKRILPTLLDGLDEQQWRSKKGACDLLGAMAYLDSQQLAANLPDIIPPLTNVLNDSHKEVRLSANRSLQRFGEVISNPEIKSLVGVLLKALSDPTKYTEDALNSLIKVSFMHFLDAPSLALVVRILQRGLNDRSATKQKSAQIIGSLAHLAERKDLITHLSILVAGLKTAIVDPVPTTRATASKALGSLVEKLGENSLPDLIPSLMTTLRSDTGAGDRLGSAQALSEVLAGLGTDRLEETLPTILQNASSVKPAVREGFVSLFIYLPACFGNSFTPYLNKIIPPILSGLADEVDSIRETSLRAGRLLVKNFSTRAIDLLLPELERGLADDSHRIRLSSVELVGDLLFNLTGISGKIERDEAEEGSVEASQSLLEALGEEKRNKVLSSLYICRCDTSGLVRTAAIGIWKSLVSSPRILKELVPTLTQLLIRRLGSSNTEQKVIAGNALGELIRKAGDGVLSTLLPTLDEGLQVSTDSDAKQGICIALYELLSSAPHESLVEYEKILISVVRTALVDSVKDVREAAAEAFDALQNVFGRKAVDQILPYLLNLLRTSDEAANALSALLTLLEDNTRSNMILPNLLPSLLISPVTSFNAKALASLSHVARSSMVRRLPLVLNTLVDSMVICKYKDLRADLDESFDAVLASVDEFDGLNTMMNVMITLAKHDDHRKRAVASTHLAAFFTTTEVDYSRYHQDLIRVLLISLDDRDPDVVKSAWGALNALTGHLKKEEMEVLVQSTRIILQQVGVPGVNLPGFSLPNGIKAILPIFLQGLMNGTTEQRVQAALGLSDIVDRTGPESLKPFVTQITGPLIRVVSERSTEVKVAILIALNNLLEKIPTFLKPFLPQLQRTFAKSLADTSSEALRSRAAKALGTLIKFTPKIDPLIAELVTGSKLPDLGVRNAMLKALYEVISKAGDNTSDVSKNLVLGIVDTDAELDENVAITHARLLGATVKHIPSSKAQALLKARAVTINFTRSTVLSLNAVFVEAPGMLALPPFADATPLVVSQGILDKKEVIAENCILAGGKYLLVQSDVFSFESNRTLFQALASVITPGSAIDSRRLALVVLRTVARRKKDVVRPHLPLLVGPVFASVRDPVIPIKLSAEQVFLEMFDVVNKESSAFDTYLTSDAAATMAPSTKRTMQDYFRRVALRLAAQARERKAAEGGQGGLDLTADERDDEREVWSVGRVDLGDVGSLM